MKLIYKITLLLFLCPYICSAYNNDKKHEKRKVIKKEFSVNKDATVSIDNKYGNLNITTWDKNLVEIEVTISVKGDDIESIEEKLTKIDVEFESSSSLVYAKTVFENVKKSWSFWKKSNNLSYQINYKIKMPKSNSVDLDNDYGSIYLDYLSGKANINCDYGKIFIGELFADNNTIDLDYCSPSSIAYMKSGNINIDYSNISIDEAENLKVDTDYSTVKIEKVNTLNFHADYGTINIEEATNVKGNSDYVNLRFGIIKKELIMNTDYGSLSVKKLKKGFNIVDIDGQYAGIRINIDDAADFDFDFELDLQYAGLKIDNNKVEFFKKISKSTKKYYQGKYGKGNSNSKITIKSQYGGVSIK